MKIKTSTIDEVCNVEYGTRVVRKKDGGSIYPVYGGGGETFFLDKTNRKNRVVIARFAMSKKCTRFVKGDFFLNDSGLTLSPKTNELSQKYLDVITLGFNNLIYDMGKGTAQRNLDMKQFRLLKISYPDSIPEQQHIVAKLDAAFAEIDKTLAATKNNFKNVETLFQKYLMEAFKPSGEDWKNYSIKQLGKVITGNTPKTSVVENYGDFISFVKPGDFKTDGSIDFEKQKLSKIGMFKSRIVEKKSALMVCIGATIGKCGYAGINIVTNQQINSITPTSNFNYKFIYYQMKTSEFQNKVMDNYGQATLPIINKSKWQSLTMKFPNLNEQLMIVRKLDNLRIETDTFKNKLLNKIDKLSSLKLSILRQELTEKLTQAA